MEEQETVGTQQPDMQAMEVKTTPSNIQVTIKPEVDAMKDIDPSAPATTEATTMEAADDIQATQTAISNTKQAETDLTADLAKKGVDFNELASEYDTSGTLSDASLAKLEAAGYPKSVVDAYVSGLTSTTEKFVDTVKGFAGGEEAYAQLGQFIRSQGDGVINAFNSAIQSGDLGQIQLAINGLKSSMVQSYGTNNRTIMGGGIVAQGNAGFETANEMVQAMSDKRYQTDAQYTREVINKVKYSKLF